MESDLDERTGEAGQRARLAYQAALSERLHGYAEALQRMLRSRPPSRAHLPATLLEVAKLSSQALDVERTSIWLFDDEHQHLRRTVQLSKQNQEPFAGEQIEVLSCPGYVRALAESAALAVQDALGDPRTRELEAYLRRNDVGALLDIPIAVPGGVLGVVCHEHVGGPRVWQLAEVEFAANAASLVALALETERRLIAEHEAAGTEARYRHLVESLPVTVYSLDVHTRRLTYVSPRIAELGGWSPDQWLAAGVEHWIEQIHPDDRPLARARLEAGAGQGLPGEITYRVQLPDARIAWVRDTCRIVRDHLGQPLALQGTLCEITGQMEAERQRGEIEHLQRTLIEHADLYAVMLDPVGRIAFVNEFFLRATGHPREALLGQDWFERLVAPEKAEFLRERYRAEVRLDPRAPRVLAPRFEISLRTSTGEYRRVLWVTSVLRDAAGSLRGVFGLGTDVTRRQRLEVELLQQTKIESLGRLASSVAHEFNELLTTMMASALELEGGLASDTAGVAHSALLEALGEAAELTRSLLAYGRRAPSAVEEFALDRLVEDLHPLVEAAAGDLRLRVALGCGSATVSLDPAQLRQVIVNLINNAVDATREHGTRIELRTCLERVDDAAARQRGLQRGGEFAVLCVSDDGRGMTARTLGRVFDPFFTTKTEGRATGLGLALCQTIVQRAGGFIAVETAVSHGTTLRLYFPRAGAGLQQESAIGLYRGSARRSRPHVLVVDDLPAIREPVVNGLQKAGYSVAWADDLASASEALACEPVDLLITDDSLPDGSGHVLARSARGAHPDLMVLLISEQVEWDEAFDAALTKPFDVDSLLGIVRELCPID